MSGDESPADGLKQLGESAVNTVLDRVGRGVSKVQERRPLAYDLLESDDEYLVVFDAPGATNSDVQVQFRDGAVEVKVDRFREFHEEFEMRFPGRGLSLDGSAELPEGASVDPTGADATLTEHGALHVRVPKTEDDGVAVDDEPADETDDGPASIELDEADDAVHEAEESAAGVDDDHDDAAHGDDHDDAAHGGDHDDAAHGDDHDEGGDYEGDEGGDHDGEVEDDEHGETHEDAGTDGEDDASDGN